MQDCTSQPLAEQLGVQEPRQKQRDWADRERNDPPRGNMRLTMRHACRLPPAACRQQAERHTYDVQEACVAQAECTRIGGNIIGPPLTVSVGDHSPTAGRGISRIFTAIAPTPCKASITLRPTDNRQPKAQRSHLAGFAPSVATAPASKRKFCKARGVPARGCALGRSGGTL